MKSLIIFILICLLSQSVFADCDWKTGITEGPNKTFIYNEACHQKVGQLVQDSLVKDEQISKYAEAIKLKDLAIQASDQRVMLWQKTADDELDRLNKISADQKRSDWLYFGLGILTMVGAGYVASRAYR